MTLALVPTTGAWLPMVWQSYFGLEHVEIMAACLWQWNRAWDLSLRDTWFLHSRP